MMSKAAGPASRRLVIQCRQGWLLRLRIKATTPGRGMEANST